jgi:hypothetical protein
MIGKHAPDGPSRSSSLTSRAEAVETVALIHRATLGLVSTATYCDTHCMTTSRGRDRSSSGAAQVVMNQHHPSARLERSRRTKEGRSMGELPEEPTSAQHGTGSPSDWSLGTMLVVGLSILGLLTGAVMAVDMVSAGDPSVKVEIAHDALTGLLLVAVSTALGYAIARLCASYDHEEDQMIDGAILAMLESAREPVPEQALIRALRIGHHRDALRLSRRLSALAGLGTIVVVPQGGGSDTGPVSVQDLRAFRLAEQE